MFYKLALKNVTKSIRDFTVYFLTLTFGVCLFYMFNSIDSQAAMMVLSKTKTDSMKMLTEAISYISVFISVILGFLIVYANGFLIKRRKKELGIYMTLGMEKRKISRVVILETLLIGIFALAVGLIIGVFASQGLSVITAKMFQANLKAFHFIFSVNAFYKTLLYFGIIFLIVMFFNTVSISKLKLIDLLTAGKKNESLKIKRLWMSVVLFIISVACLGIAYSLIIKNGMFMLNDMFTASIVLGCVGTLLFFLSLSGFLLRVVKTSKRMYFRNLNMFILRQINSRINTAFVSMSVICIMLLITIGTVSTGMGIANVLTENVNRLTPFDISFTYSYEESQENKVTDIAKQIKSDKIDLDRYAKEYAQLNIYISDVKYGDLHLNVASLQQVLGNESSEKFLRAPVNALSLSEYNKALKMMGKPEVVLRDDQFLVNCNFEQMIAPFNQFLQSNDTITINGMVLHSAQKTVTQTSLLTSMSGMDSGTLVVPDKAVSGFRWSMRILNMNYKNGIDEQEFLQKLESVYSREAIRKKTVICPYDMEVNRTHIYEQSLGLGTIVSFMGIYIGIVFLITSAAVLALQQLSEASDNVERYGLLRKLGTEEKMINRALFEQIGIYFFLPLSLAVVHSVVGVRVANNVISMIGHLNTASSSLFTASVFLLIYGGYFIATYLGSKSMIRQKS